MLLLWQLFQAFQRQLWFSTLKDEVEIIFLKMLLLPSINKISKKVKNTKKRLINVTHGGCQRPQSSSWLWGWRGRGKKNPESIQSKWEMRLRPGDQDQSAEWDDTGGPQTHSSKNVVHPCVFYFRIFLFFFKSVQRSTVQFIKRLLLRSFWTCD